MLPGNLISSSPAATGEEDENRIEQRFIEQTGSWVRSGCGGLAFVESLVAGDLFEEASDDVIGINTLGLGCEVESHPVAHDGQGQSLHVFERGIEPTVQDGTGLGSGDQVQAGARSATPGDEVLDEAGCVFLAGTGGPDERGNILEDVVGYRNPGDEILEREDICGNVRRTGPMFEAALQGLRDLELVGDVRGSHFMMCIESVADRETKALLPAAVNVGKRIADACQKRGLIVRPLGHLNILSPPLIVTDVQIEEIAQTLRGAIRETMDDLVREGLWQPKC